MRGSCEVTALQAVLVLEVEREPGAVLCFPFSVP